MRIRTLAALVLLAGARIILAQKNELKTRYDKKILVVLREGLAVGLCSAPSRGGGPAIQPPELPVTIEGEAARFHEETGLRAMGTGCASIAPEPLLKGELLLVRRIWFHDGVQIEVASQPHHVERTPGAAYEIKRSHSEIGLAQLHFKSLSEKDAMSSTAAISLWVRPFDSIADAAKFAAELSAPPPPKEIKIGMTVDEVARTLGAPQTKVDLGEKTLYRYKDLTVEFRSGKVADVR